MHDWLPQLASQHGAALDHTNALVHWLMLALFVGWGSFFVFVLWRFRAKRNPTADAMCTGPALVTAAPCMLY